MEEATKAARASGLRYVSDTEPGIQRVSSGKRFRYLRKNGSVVRNLKVLKRIQSLAIPPAWTDVWICASPKGHLQATGRDARRRKQFRYHPRWCAFRDESKYERVPEFASAFLK
ncbi:MAG: hypothetical protein QM703_18335 [Gemmatales bacterium]